MRLAYIASRYPLVSHAFILREVIGLRRAGAEVHTFTVRRAGPEHVISAADREAEESTHPLVPASARVFVSAHARAFSRRPRRYLETLALALSLSRPGLRGRLWQLFYFGEAVLLWRECERRRLRHIHAHHANVASDVALLASHLGGAQWSWSLTLHGPTELFDVREHRLARKAELARFVVCISDFARSQLMGLLEPDCWPKLHVVHCGVDLAHLCAGDHQALASGGLKILTVGRLVPVKGQAVLLEALADLTRRGLDARLTVVGDGPQRERLRVLARRLGVGERVEFPGSVGQDRIAAYYAQADVFALPSFAEGLPVVLMEAMAAALPVVASRITGIPELVEERVSGLLVRPGRPDELADALAEVLRQPPERRRAMGDAGRAKVEAEFDIERTTKQLAAIFDRQLAS